MIVVNGFDGLGALSQAYLLGIKEQSISGWRAVAGGEFQFAISMSFG
jgi:hypothetical protein